MAYLKIVNTKSQPEVSPMFLEMYMRAQIATKNKTIHNMNLPFPQVASVGLEPTRPLGTQDFLTTTVFTALSVCGLDFPFTIAFALGAARQVSTPSFSGLARDYHFRGFPDFEQFYSKDFSKGTQI
jgi:hypothetical protein